MLLIGMIALLAVLLKIQGATFDIQIGSHRMHFRVIPIKPVREYRRARK